jgi:hypothetical protein
MNPSKWTNMRMIRLDGDRWCLKHENGRCRNRIVVRNKYDDVNTVRGLLEGDGHYAAEANA